MLTFRKLALSALLTLLVLGGALLSLHLYNARASAWAAQGEQAKSQPPTPPAVEVRQQRQTSAAPASPTASVQSITNSAPITINDNTTASLYPSIINVSGITSNLVTQVRAQLNGFTHTFPGDVDIILEGPQGQRSILMSDAGGDPNVSGLTLTFDSASANTLPEAGPLVSGTTRPANYSDSGAVDTFPVPGPGALTDAPADLSVFNLTNPNGAWKLYVVDDAGTDTGQIASGWTLILTEPQIFTVNSTADTSDGTCNAANCTLREALAAAMAVPGSGGDLIQFSALFNTPQTINLLTALPDINKSLTITGPGAHLLTVRRDFNAPDFRIFNITNAATNGVAISGMTITGGNVGNGVTFGGGIFSLSNLTLTGVHITGNTAGLGGGVGLGFADGSFTNCTFSNNSSTNAANAAGGGIFYQGDGNHTLRVVNSTVSGNSAVNHGGGIRNYSSGGNNSRLEVVNSTITGNTAPNGGGISTFTQGAGSTATTTLRNTIVAGNTPNNLATGTVVGGAATFQTLGFNLSDNYNGVFMTLGTDITSATPRLGPLSLGGGTTPTHALLGGSPALDAGNASGQATDQRGVNRGFDTAGVPNASDNSDIGAVEMQSLIVTSTANSSTGSLRNILSLADSNPSLNDIIFDPAVFNTAQTITLTDGQLSINSNVTINGNGANLLTVQRDQMAADFRIFDIPSGITGGVAISGMTITGGRISSFSTGGGIRSLSNLTLTGIHLTGNSATNGGGGGVNLAANGVFTGCTFSLNTASSLGGAIDFRGETGRVLRLSNSTISGNQGDSGGGISHSSFGGNSQLEVVSSTITNNTSVSGGGIRTSTSNNGTNAATTLRNTIIAGNTPNNLATNSFGGTPTFITYGFNLASDDGGGFLNVAPVTTDKINANAGLAALGDNGGTVPTHTLLSGSLALDAGHSSGATSDQRGSLRPVNLPVANASGGDGADIGAFEAQTEPPLPTISVNDVTAAEGDNVVFTVTLSAPSGSTVTLTYNTTGGTATADVDYNNQNAPATLTFAPGTTTQTVSVPTFEDFTFEPNETFFINLASPTNATIADNQGLGTIQNDDPQPTLSINDVAQPEGNSGTTVFTFNVTLSNPSSQTITVNYGTADGTAVSPLDFASVGIVGLTFNPGETSKPATVSVVGDTTFELSEDFLVNLSTPTNATIADNQGLGIIINDDPQPTIAINDVTQNEGNAGTSNFNFTVSLSNASSQTVTVSYQTANGTASAPGDYTAIGATTLTFNPGETSKPVTVQVTGDTTGELNETFFVNLSSPTNATIANNQGLGTITNDDAFLVTNTNDAGPGSLRQAILDANATGPGADTINFSALFNTAQTITLTTDGLFIFGSLTINGPGANLLTVRRGPNAATGFRIFTIPQGVTNGVHISGMTVMGGGEVSFGGGISSDSHLTLTNVHVTGNQANVGGGVNLGANGVFTNCAFSLNTASAQGSAINFGGGNGRILRLINSTVSGNTVGDFGGGIYHQNFGGNSQLEVTSSTIANNTSGSGGGIYTYADNLLNQGANAATTLRNTIIANNTPNNLVTVTENGGVTPVTSQGFNLASDNGGGFLNGTGDKINAFAGLAPLANNGGPTPTHALFSTSAALDAGNNSGSGLTTDQRGAGFNRTVDLPVANAPNSDGTDIGAFEAQTAPATPSFAINDVTQAEGNSGTTNFVFTVTLSHANAQPVSVDYMPANGTASAPGDYTALPQTTLTFAPNETSKQITVAVVGETVFEPNETFFVNLSNAQGAQIADNQGLGTITNDDTQPTIAINDVTLPEGNAGTSNFNFTVSLSNASSQTVTVSYQTANGTATALADYTAIGATTLTFNPGETSKPVTVSVVGETLVESDETFFVNLSNPTNATLADNQGLGTIVNDDAAQTFTVTTAADAGAGSLRQAMLDANANGPTADTINFSALFNSVQTINLASTLPDIAGNLTINGPGANNLTVRRDTGGDYRIFTVPGSGLNVTLSGLTISNGRVSGAGGGIFSASNLTLTNCLISGNEAVGDVGGGVFLGSANGTFTGSTFSGNTAANRGGGISYEVGSAVNVTLTITNCTVSGNTATGAGAGGGLFNLMFAGTSTLQVTNCTFTNNVGSLADTGGLRIGAIGAGTTATAQLRNTIIANSTGANLGAATASGGVATITSQGFNLTSDGGGGFLNQATDKINANPILAPLANNGGPTPTHALLAGSAALDAGDNTGSGVTTDQRGAGFLRTVNLPNANAGDGTDIGAFEAQTVPPPGIIINDITVAEGSAGTSTATFNVTLTAASAQTVTVQYATANGTATAGSDYVATSGTLTFNPGVTSLPINVTINGDMVEEPSETFFVNLTSPTNAVLLDAQGAGTIQNAYIVTNANDSDAGSLRQAILDANADPGPNQIAFEPVFFAVVRTINLASALPDLTGSVTINGPSANLLTVRRNDGAPDFRIFNIGFGIAGGVTISGMTISNGRVSGVGGGIFSQSNLTLTNVHVTGNQVTGSGGGVSLTFADGVFTGCTLSNNTATTNGGAIYYQGDGNHTLRLVNSTVSGNLAGAGGGSGILNGSNGGDSRLEVINSTLANNTATGNGGGIRTFADASAGTTATTTLRNSIIANNTPNNLATATNGSGVATVTSQGFNLANDSGGGFLNQPTDLINANPLLGLLQNNGGSTPTHALLPGSLAINAGTNTGVPATDQRGIARPQQATTDIGAFESRGFTLAVTSGSGQSTLINTAFANPLVATVSSAFSEPVQGGLVSFAAPVSGASATLTGNPATIQANGQASVTATANGTSGSYNVAANTSGAAAAVNFMLANTPNTAPTFTPAAALTRQQGSPAGAAVTIGTVADAQTPAGNLTVTQIAGGTATGITVTGITNTNGTITAMVSAGCTATTGTVRFQVSDGSLTGTGDLQVNVTPNTPPTLTYANVSVNPGGAMMHNPATGPSDNGTISTIVVQSQGTYTGTIAVNNTTGVVSLSNAAPNGAHTITIRATDNCGAQTNASFTLTVSAGCPTITVNPSNPSLPNGRAGVGYSQTFTQTGGAGTITWSVSAGSLPTGLSLTAGGLLSGTPTVNGSFGFTIRATDQNNCTGERAYTLLIQPPCPTITVNPATLANGFQGTAYNQTLTATGGTAPYTFAVTTGSLPGGLTLAGGGALTGTPAAAGTFTFTVTATDNTGCTGTRSYTVIVSGNGLMFFPLPAPVRLLDTRPGASPNACSQPNQPIAGQTSRTQPGRNLCTIPANAQALTGNVTTVQSGGGFLTLYPSDATQPTVASTNYGVNEIINNVFTVGLGADGAFKIFANNTTDVVVDVTGYYAPPATGGLFFHPLPAPVRLLETRAGQPVGCVLPGTPLVGNAESTQQAISPCTGIPAAARAIVGNATTVNPLGGGFLTIFPADAPRPLVASSNFNTGQVVNGPFAVGLAANGQFKIFTTSTTDLVVDVLGYYSPEVNDANGTGLLLTPLAHPVRLLETRPGLPVGCFKPGAPLTGGSETIQTARGTCDGLTIPANALGVVGNATVVFPVGPGFLTLWPSTAARPLVATSNYNPGDVGNRHFIVGLGQVDGAFKLYTHATSHLVVDLSGHFAP